ncbi:MAG: hypothetical protein PUB89_06195 [Oscillospiraceae bacterium]|nr:hypothetical protein [Oscillospiraceae bacterium]MDD6082423.1 hypothetical protein [Oscillospiraceae bacterium]
MRETLYVYNVDTYFGRLIRDNNEYRFIIDDDSDIFAKNAINTNALDRLDSEKIYLIMVDDRVCPPNRYNIDSLLMSYGLRVYDQWELLKRTYGMNVNDCIWMSEKKIDASWFWSRHPRSRYTSREKIDDYREKHGYPRKYGSLKQ